MTVDKSALLKRRLGEGEHEIPGFGTVRIRSLSVDEVHRIRKLAGDDAAQERRMIAAALLDPELTEDEVATWQKNAPPGEINGVVAAIVELSGLAADATKSGVSGVRE